MRRPIHLRIGPVLLLAGLSLATACGGTAEPQAALKFAVSFPESAHPEPITGRVFVIVSRTDSREPRFQVSPYGVPFWGLDVHQLLPGDGAVVDRRAFGYPLESLAELPPGEYFVQGFIHVYTEFKRSDGYSLWLHQDRWEGQRWNRSPGNLFSDVVKVEIDPKEKRTIELVCGHMIPPVTVQPDSPWVKRVKIRSRILSEFWGEPMDLGAVVLLPAGYEEEPGRKYPVNYLQGHFSLRAPYGFREAEPGEEKTSDERGSDFYRYWTSDECPRMIAVTFQHPCPYYDDSYAVNSPNVGPYGDAILQELIPYLEENFRMIREPWARILSGGSTGGWIALMLQVFYPDYFGGVFALCPDPVDFRDFQCVDIYRDKNAYEKEFGWRTVPTASDRSTDGIVTLTSRQRNLYELAMGSRNRSGDQIDIFEAAFGPIGEDGYVKPLFDKRTGEIDREVAEYWREHFDLNHILQRDWEELGPKLRGKLHIYTGDMDTFYLNNAVKKMEEFLEGTTSPPYDGEVAYGDGQPHCWGPYGAELIDIIGGYIRKTKPRDSH